MSYLDHQFWKPDIPDKPKKKKYKSKQKKGRSKRHNPIIRESLIRHFHLPKYCSNVAICFCIHKETGSPMPDKDRALKSYMKQYWRQQQGKGFTNYRMMADDQFYKSTKWRELRHVALVNSGARCTLCGASAKDGIQLHVDHIKPRSKYPELALDLDNLQILCEDCNLGKSNVDDTDWR